MEQWNAIRHRVLVEGKSKHSVCKEFGLHGQTLQKLLDHSEPPGYRMQQPRKKRKLEPFQPTIGQILNDDRAMPRKQWNASRERWTSPARWRTGRCPSASGFCGDIIGFRVASVPQLGRDVTVIRTDHGTAPRPRDLIGRRKCLMAVVCLCRRMRALVRSRLT